MNDEPDFDELAAEWAPGSHRVRRSRTGLWIALGIGFLTLAVVTVMAVVWLTRPKDPGPGERAVAYLNAVAAADASAAVDLAATKPTGPLISDEALAASMQTHPLTDITLVEVTSMTTTQSDGVVDYKRGGRPVRTTIGMVPDGEGNWLVRRPTATVRIAPSPQMISPTLDGIPLESATYAYTVELFPGAHTLSAQSEWLEFPEPIMVDAPGTVAMVDPVARVSEAYAPKLRSVLDERIKTCVAARELAPKGCPWARKAADGQPIVRGSARYELLNAPLADFTAPGPGPIEAHARGDLDLRLRLTATAQSGGQVSEDFAVKARYATDLLTEDLQVIWEND